MCQLARSVITSHPRTRYVTPTPKFLSQLGKSEKPRKKKKLWVASNSTTSYPTKSTTAKHSPATHTTRPTQCSEDVRPPPTMGHLLDHELRLTCNSRAAPDLRGGDEAAGGRGGLHHPALPRRRRHSLLLCVSTRQIVPPSAQDRILTLVSSSLRHRRRLVHVLNRIT